jgi:hypothetical protein
MDPRIRHFDDRARPDVPFTDPTWRGCCLDRDRFDATRMPRFLFEALMAATGTQAIDVHFYMPESAVLGVAPALLGATPALAARIDAELAAYGTGLALMTAWDWPGIRTDDPRVAFMRAAVGPEPRYWPAP